jgi:hypothetical protein
MAEGGELARELRCPWGWNFAARIEIPAAEEIGSGDDGCPHGAILIGSLRPRQSFVKPKIEAHGPMLHRAGQVHEQGQQLVRMEGLAEDAATEEARGQFEIRSGGHVQQW